MPYEDKIMERVLFNIDDIKYRQEAETAQIKVIGWCITDGNDQYTLTVQSSSGEELPSQTDRVPREDVFDAYSSLMSIEEDEGFGFNLSIECFARDIENGLCISASNGGLIREIYRCESRDKLESAKAEPIEYGFDIMEADQGDIILRGWVMPDSRGRFGVSVYDKNGKKIASKTDYLVRPDVNRRYPAVDKRYLSGFNLRFEDIKSRCYTVEFSDEDHSCSTDILRKTILEEAKRRKRAYTVPQAIKEEITGDHLTDDLKLLLRSGFSGLKKEWYIRYVSGLSSYDAWFRKNEPSKKVLEKQKEDVFEYAPKISLIVPAYHTPAAFLKQMVGSVQAQTYSNWELCIADGGADDAVVEKIMRTYVKKDSRIKYKKLERNEGIAGNTNKALELATGEFYALLDHDDILTPDALYEIVSALNENPGADVVYTDEDKVTMDLRMYFDPNFKSDFNREMLRCCNYICHLFAVNRSVVDKAGSFNDRYEGSQDFDFILRCTENADLIIHVPKILYHWRSHPASTAADPTTKLYCYESGVRAIDDHLKRQGINGCASMLPGCYGYYHVDYEFDETDYPFISIVIIDKGNDDLLQSCVDSVLVKTAYPEYEILIIKSRSASDRSIAHAAVFEKDEHINTLTWEGGYERSSMINFGAEHAKGEYLLFLDSDTEVITDGWLKILITDMKRNNTGAAGGKLLYPDETIEHAGIVVGRDVVIGYPFAGHDRNDTNFGCRALLQQNVNAVSAACMIVSKRVFEMVNGFDRSLKAVYDDVDFCLKLREAGFDIIYEPTVELYHNVPKSEYKQYNAKKKRRAEQEYEYVRNKWADAPECGQYYSKELIDIMCSARYFKTEMGVKDK